MTRIIIGPKMTRAAAKLGAEVTAEAEKRLAQLARDFGKPHVHSGLGLQKLGRRSFELRLGLQWRVVLLHRGNDLLAVDIINHDGVLRWLKSNR